MQMKNTTKLSAELMDRCLLDGEFQLRHGGRSAQKFDFDRVSQSSRIRDKLLFRRTAKSLGLLIMDQMPECEMVVTVANGANPLANKVARYASLVNKSTPEILSRETHKLEDGTFILNGGNIFVRDRKVVIVDDVFTVGTNIGLVA